MIYEYKIRICDFGYAYQRKDQENILLNGRVGSCSYMAPEVYAMQSYHGVHADLWSSAVCKYILLFNLFNLIFIS